MGKYERFWRWFISNQMSIYHCDDPDDEKFNELANQLHLVNEDLTFECGPLLQQRQLVISAGGLERAFHDVIGLVAVAPDMQFWKLVAFMPRGPLPIMIDYEAERVNSMDVEFSLLDNGKMVGIYLFIPCYVDSNPRLKQIGYMLLDHVLGEFDVETKLGLVKMLSPDAPKSLERFPLSELPSLFDRLYSQIS